MLERVPGVHDGNVGDAVEAVVAEAGLLLLQ